jgi:methyltransferase (TIGR00027 family)
MALHQVLRKRALEDDVVRSLDSGFSQLVVLGGGFDTLAARLAKSRPTCNVLEADHPATQAVKHHVLQQAGYLGPNLSLIPVDFNRTEARELLLGLPAFRRDAPTLFLCEGVLMYLAPEAVDRLISGLASLPCPSSRFAFTFMEAEPGGPIAFRNASPLVSAWLRLRNETFTWGIRGMDLGAFLSRHGFDLEEVLDHADLRRRYLEGREDARIAEGEKIAFAAHTHHAGYFLPS